MPRQRQPPSLRKASIENIVCHFEDFWRARSSRDSGQSDVFTPFQYLCDDMVQEIIDMLGKRKLLCPHHFQILLHSNIRRLNLGVRRIFYDYNSTIKTLGIRCQELTHLNLEGLTMVNPEILCTLMRNLPQIVCLKHIRPDANVIKAISRNCPNILELDLVCFFPHTYISTNLLYLCNSPDNPKVHPKLRKLAISGNYTLSTDIVVHLLKNQTSLQCLGICEGIDHAFDQMYGEEFRSSKEVPSERIHNLLDISIEGSDLKNFNLSEADRLDLTFQCCPCLTKLTLIGLRERGSFNNVAKLKHLKTLIVSAFRKGDFKKYMVPLLSEIGDSLTYLECVGFDEVSLILIGKSCHNLESLELREVGLISEQPPIYGDVTRSFPYFTNLKVLSINLTWHHSLSANELGVLLRNATKLVHFTLKNMKSMTDIVIAEAYRRHGFRNLRTCFFGRCSSISVESIWMLLCPDNPLERLSVFDCKNITIQDLNLVRQEAELRQFDIDIRG